MPDIVVFALVIFIIIAIKTSVIHKALRASRQLSVGDPGEAIMNLLCEFPYGRNIIFSKNVF